MEVFIDDRTHPIEWISQHRFNLDPDTEYVAWVIPAARRDKLEELEKTATVPEAKATEDHLAFLMVQMTNAMGLPATTSNYELLEAVRMMKRREATYWGLLEQVTEIVSTLDPPADRDPRPQAFEALAQVEDAAAGQAKLSKALEQDMAGVERFEVDANGQHAEVPAKPEQPSVGQQALIYREILKVMELPLSTLQRDVLERVRGWVSLDQDTDFQASVYRDVLEILGLQRSTRRNIVTKFVRAIKSDSDRTHLIVEALGLPTDGSIALVDVLKEIKKLKPISTEPRFGAPTDKIMVALGLLVGTSVNDALERIRTISIRSNRYRDTLDALGFSTGTTIDDVLKEIGFLKSGAKEIEATVVGPIIDALGLDDDAPSITVFAKVRMLKSNADKLPKVCEVLGLADEASVGEVILEIQGRSVMLTEALDGKIEAEDRATAYTATIVALELDEDPSLNQTLVRIDNLVKRSKLYRETLEALEMPVGAPAEHIVREIEALRSKSGIAKVAHAVGLHEDAPADAVLTKVQMLMSQSEASGVPAIIEALGLDKDAPPIAVFAKIGTLQCLADDRSAESSVYCEMLKILELGQQSSRETVLNCVRQEVDQSASYEEIVKTLKLPVGVPNSELFSKIGSLQSDSSAYRNLNQSVDGIAEALGLPIRSSIRDIHKKIEKLKSSRSPSKQPVVDPDIIDILGFRGDTPREMVLARISFHKGVATDTMKHAGSDPNSGYIRMQTAEKAAAIVREEGQDRDLGHSVSVKTAERILEECGATEYWKKTNAAADGEVDQAVHNLRKEATGAIDRAADNLEAEALDHSDRDPRVELLREVFEIIGLVQATDRETVKGRIERMVNDSRTLGSILAVLGLLPDVDADTAIKKIYELRDRGGHAGDEQIEPVSLDELTLLRELTDLVRSAEGHQNRYVRVDQQNLVIKILEAREETSS